MASRQPDAGANLMAQLTATRPEIWQNRPATTSLNVTHHSDMIISKRRRLDGDHVVYDVDDGIDNVNGTEFEDPGVRVTPITKYCAEGALVLGRRVAVNKKYVCYGLKLGAIRVFHVDFLVRSLLRGLSQNVRDMAFFSEDVNLLAGASADGQVCVWKITEGGTYHVDYKPEIKVEIIMAIQIVGDVKFTHSRVCWHCHKQEVLFVGVGNNVLRINTIKVGKGGVDLESEPLKWHVGMMNIDGVDLVGTHDGEVTDLSMSTTCLVSASIDGTVKVWDEGKLLPLAVLQPYDGLPVNSVLFMTSPNKPQHTVLVTGGPLNREIKIWTCTSDDGWLRPSNVDSWHCTQTLELKSSSGTKDEDTFFNHVTPVSQAGLVLIANAMKNALYVVHLDYDVNPAATRMDYFSEFSVGMPILCLVATSDLVAHGEGSVEAFCVQTQAVQQCSIGLSQCLPPPLENLFERLDTSFSDQEVASSQESAT